MSTNMNAIQELNRKDSSAESYMLQPLQTIKPWSEECINKILEHNQILLEE